MPSPSISPRNQFGHALRAVRKARELSQEAFGLQSSRTYVSTLERGLKSPTLNKVDELAQVMSVHPITLLALAYADLGHGSDIDRLVRTVTQELHFLRELNQNEVKK
jgi:transcriptional regulator with XRE-family HTH domain